jgi:hypothetical protein
VYVLVHMVNATAASMDNLQMLSFSLISPYSNTADLFSPLAY